MSMPTPTLAVVNGGLGRSLNLGALGSHPYERNAFRVTGLPVTASARDISRFAERIELQQRLRATSQPIGHPAFRSQEPPTIDDLGEALRRLREPEQRLIDEFFWFWPQHWDQAHSDAALNALTTCDAERASALWREM